MLRVLQKKNPSLPFAWKPVSVQDSLDPVMAADGCLTHFERFMPRKSWPQRAEQSAISAPASGSLPIKKKTKEINNVQLPPALNAN